MRLDDERRWGSGRHGPWSFPVPGARPLTGRGAAGGTARCYPPWRPMVAVSSGTCAALCRVAGEGAHCARAVLECGNRPDGTGHAAGRGFPSGARSGMVSDSGVSESIAYGGALDRQRRAPAMGKELPLSLADEVEHLRR